MPRRPRGAAIAVLVHRFSLGVVGSILFFVVAGLGDVLAGDSGAQASA